MSYKQQVLEKSRMTVTTNLDAVAPICWAACVAF